MPPQSFLVARPGYQTFPCYVSAQSEDPCYAKMASCHACLLPSTSSSPPQDAPQKEITTVIQTFWSKKSGTRIREAKNKGFARRENSSKGRATPGCCLATPWFIHGLCLLIKIFYTQPSAQPQSRGKLQI